MARAIGSGRSRSAIGLAAGQHDGGGDDLLQLADVQRPRVQRHRAERRLLEARLAAARGAQEMPGQRADVFDAVAQRRQEDGRRAQARDDVVAQARRFAGARDHAVGRGDDAHVDAPRPRRAQRRQLAVLQEAQDLDLHLGRSSRRSRRGTACRPRLPRSGLPSPACAVRVRARAITEQLALHQLARDGRAVDGDEAPLRPLASCTARA